MGKDMRHFNSHLMEKPPGRTRMASDSPPYMSQRSKVGAKHFPSCGICNGMFSLETPPMKFTSDLVGKTEISEVSLTEKVLPTENLQLSILGSACSVAQCSQTAGHRVVQSSALVHPDNLSHSIREPDEISELHITVLSAAGLLPRVSISAAFSSNISIRQR
ncbi:hypothetical protein Q7C36_016800 [Tachysurus vachellii]|uniref:Uncharacterized protein n=1 Tax=Tachysurus vachellii TaxID=175792 RepID=A0AA88M710_TACVA|nr:hypothetical protein Q7C36_016800 [Tachysurus vachellii]